MAALKPVNLVIADDHPLIREGFQTMFKKIREINLVGTASNGEELVDAVKKHRPQVVIADVKMPVMNGVEAAKKIKADLPDTKIIALSSYDEAPLVQTMIAAGATGYLLKTAGKEEVLKAIETTLGGGSYYCAEVSERLSRILNQEEEAPVELTPREREVMLLYCQGKSSREIAKLLFISTRTLEKYRASLQQKLGTKTVAGIVLWAQREGWV